MRKKTFSRPKISPAAVHALLIFYFCAQASAESENHLQQTLKHLVHENFDL
jgi:hypothetical protein